MSIRIIVDSASDISQAEAKELGITVIPMRTTFGEEEFWDGINILNEQVQKADGIDFDMPFSLAYGGMSTNMLDKYLADHKHLYEDYVTDIPACQIGSTIGTHVGPGAIAVSFFALN